MQYWTFENRGPKQPQTLMDAIEGVPCIVTLQGQRSMLVKKRKGTLAFAVWADGEAGNGDAYAANYKFIRYVDPQPEQPVVLPATLGVGESNRLYKCRFFGGYFWKTPEGDANLLTDAGYVRSSSEAKCYEVESATNIFAVLKTLD